MGDKLPTNNELIEDRKRHFLPTGYLYHKEPIHLVKAKGEYVFDEQGREYLDGIGGIVCISAGHNHPRIKAALQEMLDQDEIQHTSLLYLSRHVVDLAKKLVEEAPEGLTKTAFTNSGSEANELAFMAARQETGETVVMSLKHSYHGGTSGVLANCGHNTWRFRSQPVTGVVSAAAPYCYRCPFGKEPDSCALECAKDVENTIQTDTHGKIAAFIAEPVMGVGGFIAAPKEYFEMVAKTVHNYGGKYISDEVQTGVGRCGEDFFVTKSLGIDADMITMAKGFGNGAPIGAVAMRPELSDSLDGKFYFNTFAGDPYQTRQASVTMDIIKEEKLVENTKAMGDRLRDGLNQLAKKHLLIGDVRGRGLLMGIELVKDRNSKAYASAECSDLLDRCKNKGLLLGKGGLFGNVLRIAPPLTIKEKHVDFMLKVIDESLAEMERVSG